MPDFIPSESTTPKAPVITDPVIVPPSIPSVLPGKKLPLLLIILIPILAITAVISIYVMLQARKMYQESITLPSPSPFATVDPTASWQTYTNEKYQFSIKYPDDFSLEEIESAGYREFGVKFINENTKENLFIEIVGNTKTNYDQLSKSYHNNDTGWSNNPSIQYTENLETKIANLNAKTFKSVVHSQIGDSNSIETTYFFVDSENYNFILSYRRPLEENTTQEGLMSPDQILSTFKLESAPKNEDLENVIKDLVYDYGKSHGITSKDQIIIKIIKIEGNYAVGNTSFTLEVEGSGSVWFATKIDNQWTVVEETQEPPSCAIMTQYYFPKNISGECVNK